MLRRSLSDAVSSLMNQAKRADMRDRKRRARAAVAADENRAQDDERHPGYGEGRYRFMAND